jgi:hypothetical protein
MKTLSLEKKVPAVAEALVSAGLKRKIIKQVE